MAVDKLDGVHPGLVGIFTTILQPYAVTLGHPIKAAQGLRTVAQQQAIYTQGRSTKGPGVDAKHPMGRTVTKCDGVIFPSNHQAKADGFGHAIDFCFVDDPRTPVDETWDEHLWATVAPKIHAKARQLGLKCGADWKSPDRPHLELP